MAMVVKNNMSAVSTLNTLNKNSNALQKSLSKVSSGMKINSAQDDASGYAISERMRVQIRSLDQANQNTQNGSSMMKTAEGAVSSTVEILKSLKEKAINAANDTNTDSDRTTIQKEIDQFIDQIDDNALTTFNGKYLVDGSKNNAHFDTFASFTNQSLAEDTAGNTTLAANVAADGKGLSNRLGESLEISSTDYITASYVKDGATHTTTFQVGDKTLQDIFTNLNTQAVDDGGTAVFAAPQMEAAGATTAPTNAEIIAKAGDDVLADLVANGTSGTVVGAYADSEALVSALTEYGSSGDATTAKNAAVTALANAVDAINVTGANNANATIGWTGADAATAHSSSYKNVTGVTVGSVMDNVDNTKTTGTAFAEDVAAAGAAANSADVSQSAAATLTVTIGTGITDNTGTLAETMSSAGAEFHAAARAGLVEAAAAAVQPVTISSTSLVTGATIDADNAQSYIDADSVGHTDIAGGDLQTLAGTINGWVAGTVDATLTGDKLVAAVQTALSTQAVKDAALATDATGVALDNANHQIDAAVAEKVKAAATAGGGGATATDNGLVATGKQIGFNKSGDKVYTADGTNGLTVSAATAGVGGQVAGITISVSDSNGNVRKAANAALDNFAMSIRAENQTTGGKDANNNIKFQVGANANQAISVSLTDMRSEALGLKGSDGTKVSVATQDKANAAVSVFDNAISKALDQQTTIGSIEARLEYTSQNLTTSSENVQAAESTIRDADMAKEMTNYTKNNVLLQAAQSMLAQANQSSSAVLSLLQ